MSIAQRFVAGEGSLHPDDCDALSAYRAESVNLPWIIFRAAFRASRTEQLPQRARAMLAALARTVDASRPYAAIYARRELLTGRAMLSMRTLYRSLEDLEAAGMIERRPQSRYVDAGLFGRSYLHLTERAAVLLGLVDPATSKIAIPNANGTTPPSAAPTASFTPPSATVADGGIHKDLDPPYSQKRQPRQVPADLQRLRALGFFDFLIFKLMREAREQGKRLSDVVEATWDHLKLAKAPINYLRALLRNPIDFSLPMRRCQNKQAAARQLAEHLANAARLAHKYAGQTFVDAEGRRQYEIDVDGESMMIVDVEEGIGRRATGWKQSFAEALASGKIRLADNLNLETFVAAHRVPAYPCPTSVAVKKSPPVEVLVDASQRPLTTQDVRAHIARLRRLLQPRVVVA
ncbi:MAG: hypothetical protein CBCREVIR_3727 [Candidatus Burkholderia crenata]|nr:MAG: hypothetical protein CBCREVIR_3727 [Candidatus Burkholderia crenata]